MPNFLIEFLATLWQYNNVAIISYKIRGTADIAHGIGTKEARRVLPQELQRIARIKLAALNAAEDLRQLKHPSFRLHQLGKERLGQWSISINSKYRICFVWTNSNNAEEVEIVDYH